MIQEKANDKIVVKHRRSKDSGIKYTRTNGIIRVNGVTIQILMITLLKKIIGEKCNRFFIIFNLTISTAV